MEPEKTRWDALASMVSRRLSKRMGSTLPAAPATGHVARETLLVRLLPGHYPHDEIEQQLYEVLSDGPLPLDVLVDEVAGRLLQVEMSCGGWAADIGVLGSGAYKPEVAGIVRALNGLSLCIEPPLYGTCSR